MKICFPVSVNKGLESPIHGHFGSAPMFLLVDVEQRSVAEVLNRDSNHQHGACSPLKALGGHKVEAVVVGGIGSGALYGLHQAGCKVYQATAGTVSANLNVFIQQQLAELTLEQTCSGHQVHDCGSHQQAPDFEFGCGF